MSRLKYAILTAAFMFAMALTFSCSRESDENPFAQQYLYCVYPVEKTCVPGVVKECPQGGAPKDVCPAEFVEKAPSSSSTRGSSSSGGSNNDPFAGIPEWEYYKESLKYYDPDDRDERCQNGVVEGRCEDNNGNDIWYSPLTHVCGEENSTYYFGTYERCGNEIYASWHDMICERCGSGYYIHNESTRCRNGVVERECRDTWYNVETHYCDSDYDPNTQAIIPIVKAKERCGSKYYFHGEDTRCQNGVVERKCRDTWYNVETHYCLEKECISDGDITWYNPITQSCDWNTGMVKNKVRCGS